MIDTTKNPTKKSITKKKPTSKKTASTDRSKKPETKQATISGKTATKTTATTSVTPEQRQSMIAKTAYLKAERRGFIGGDPEQDWLEAEMEVDASLREKI